MHKSTSSNVWFGKLDSENKYTEDKNYYNNNYYCDCSNNVYYKKEYGRVNNGNIYSNISEEEYKICLKIEDAINKYKNLIKKDEWGCIGVILNDKFLLNS